MVLSSIAQLPRVDIVAAVDALRSTCTLLRGWLRVASTAALLLKRLSGRDAPALGGGGYTSSASLSSIGPTASPSGQYAALSYQSTSRGSQGNLLPLSDGGAGGAVVMEDEPEPIGLDGCVVEYDTTLAAQPISPSSTVDRQTQSEAEPPAIVGGMQVNLLQAAHHSLTLRTSANSLSAPVGTASSLATPPLKVWTDDALRQTKLAGAVLLPAACALLALAARSLRSRPLTLVGSFDSSDFGARVSMLIDEVAVLLVQAVNLLQLKPRYRTKYPTRSRALVRSAAAPAIARRWRRGRSHYARRQRGRALLRVPLRVCLRLVAFIRSTSC